MEKGGSAFSLGDQEDQDTESRRPSLASQDLGGSRKNLAGSLGDPAFGSPEEPGGEGGVQRSA